MNNLTPFERSVLDRYLSRRKKWEEEGKETPKGTHVNQNQHATRIITGTIKDLIESGENIFYSADKDKNERYIGVAVALQAAYDKMKDKGVIASMPLHIAGKAQADNDNYLWKNWFTALSEENAGIDKNGERVGAGKSVVLAVHGGGILTPERIRRAYREGLTSQNAAKYTDEEFNNLLKGLLPSGERIDLYTVDDVKKGRIPDPFGRYAVWMPGDTAKARSSGYHSKSDFMNNELVIARAGTLEHLDAYFEKAQHKTNHNLGNWHRFGEIDFSQPQGRVLYLYYIYLGLSGDYDLSYSGRFVGVQAPEAPGARK